MPFEHALWRIDTGLTRLSSSMLENESLLEDYIHADVEILHDAWLIIGRQIRTDFGGIIDLLAIDQSGSLIVIELKKHLTPREVVAQGLDYAAWVESLGLAYAGCPFARGNIRLQASRDPIRVGLHPATLILLLKVGFDQLFGPRL